VTAIGVPDPVVHDLVPDQVAQRVGARRGLFRFQNQHRFSGVELVFVANA
jgi:hypothetical protein